MKIEGKNILCITPHCDDLEFSCFGTLNKLRKSNSIKVLNFSFCEESLPAGYNLEDIKKEFYTSLSMIGVAPSHITEYDYPVRNFTSYRQEILEALVKYRKENEVDIVLCPSSFDCHQDHNVIYNETLRAFKHITILGYDMPWNNMGFDGRLIFKLEKEDIDMKTLCISIYESQKSRNKSNPDLFYGLAKVRGIKSGVLYAEAFELINGVIE